jgi:hypothetical protein
MFNGLLDMPTMTRNYYRAERKKRRELTHLIEQI